MKPNKFKIRLAGRINESYNKIEIITFICKREGNLNGGKIIYLFK